MAIRCCLRWRFAASNETAWKLVHDKIPRTLFELGFDRVSRPGKYAVRVTASDAPSNPPDQALTSSLESDPFLIDNSPPEITGLIPPPKQTERSELRFHAKDALSVLGQAEYSINGSDWVVVEPTTRLTDSTELDYRGAALDRGAGEMTIAVRVPDEYENQAVA